MASSSLYRTVVVKDLVAGESASRRFEYVVSGCKRERERSRGRRDGVVVVVLMEKLANV